MSHFDTGSPSQLFRGSADQATLFWLQWLPSRTALIAEVAASFIQMGLQVSAHFRITVSSIVAATVLSFVSNVIVHHMLPIIATQVSFS